jgi:hypothetical protein
MTSNGFRAILICSKGCRHELIWTAEHPESHDGFGVLLDRKGKVFAGATLHADPTATIETSDRVKACGALGIPFPNRQVIEK